MKKIAMAKAWEIAKAAVVKFGGKVREYLASALKQAWAEAKQLAAKIERVQLKFTFGSYNSRRFSRPWGAIITFEGNKAKYNFNAGSYMGSDQGGTVYVDCKPGQIVAIGQRDGRGSGTQNDWMVVLPDGSTREVSRAEAFELWIAQTAA